MDVFLAFVCEWASSVASGEAGQKNMQNTLFLALLRPSFALKTKIAPPPMVLATRIGQEPVVISATKTRFQLE